MWRVEYLLWITSLAPTVTLSSILVVQSKEKPEEFATCIF